METKEELFRYGEVEHDARVVGSMRGFRKYILPGNQIRTGVWEAEEPEWMIKEYQKMDTVEICVHDNLIPGELTDEDDYCPYCEAKLIDGRWQR